MPSREGRSGRRRPRTAPDLSPESDSENGRHRSSRGSTAPGSGRGRKGTPGGSSSKGGESGAGGGGATSAAAAAAAAAAVAAAEVGSTPVVLKYDLLCVFSTAVFTHIRTVLMYSSVYVVLIFPDRMVRLCVIDDFVAFEFFETRATSWFDRNNFQVISLSCEELHLRLNFSRRFSDPHTPHINKPKETNQDTRLCLSLPFLSTCYFYTYLVLINFPLFHENENTW